MLDFKFIERVKIDRLDVKAEGEDQEITVIEVKAVGRAPGKILADILGCSDVQAAAFWYANDEQSPVYPGLTRIAAWPGFDDCQVIVGGTTFKACTVRRFQIKPTNNRELEIVCSIKFAQLTEKQAGFLCHQCKHLVDIEIKGQPDMFDGDAPDLIDAA